MCKNNILLITCTSRTFDTHAMVNSFKCTVIFTQLNFFSHSHYFSLNARMNIYGSTYDKNIGLLEEKDGWMHANYAHRFESRHVLNRLMHIYLSLFVCSDCARNNIAHILWWHFFVKRMLYTLQYNLHFTDSNVDG